MTTFRRRTPMRMAGTAAIAALVVATVPLATTATAATTAATTAAADGAQLAPLRSVETTDREAARTTTSVGAFCYSQEEFSFDGIAISSQNFEAKFDVYDDMGADDFMVGETGCKVKTVVAAGSYSRSGAVQTANVTFYKDNGAEPGRVIKAKTGKVTEDVNGVLTISLGKRGVKLAQGQTWISVQANLDFDVGGQWYWYTVTNGGGDAGQWRNPGGGFDLPRCIDWCDASKAGGTSNEFSFSLF